MYVCFSKTPALSPTGDARPFLLASGDGTTLGEGLGVLTSTEAGSTTPRRDGDRIYAVIKESGTPPATARGTPSTPRLPPGRWRKRLRRAYESAGVSPNTIELVEAHGTGTKVDGDAVEGCRPSAEVYRSLRGRGDLVRPRLGRSRQIGHTERLAAGRLRRA